MQHNTAWQSSSGTPRHAAVTAREDALVPFFTAGCREHGRVHHMERKRLGGLWQLPRWWELQAENLRSLSSSRDKERFRAASQHWQWVLTGGITAHPGDRNTLPLAGLMAARKCHQTQSRGSCTSVQSFREPRQQRGKQKGPNTKQWFLDQPWRSF